MLSGIRGCNIEDMVTLLPECVLNVVFTCQYENKAAPETKLKEYVHSCMWRCNVL